MKLSKKEKDFKHVTFKEIVSKIQNDVDPTLHILHSDDFGATQVG